MTTLPGPVRAALGLVASALDTARTLPEKAPEIPMLAVTTALQYSLRGQQRYAELMVRGDELIGRIRGVPDEAPAWATFDDDEPDTDPGGQPSAGRSSNPRADFDVAPPARAKSADQTFAGKTSASQAAPGPRAPAKQGPVKQGPVKQGPAKKAAAKKAAAPKPAVAPKATQTAPAKKTAPAKRVASRSSAFDLVDPDLIEDAIEPAVGPALTEDEPGTVS